jgi:hypothetical protein
MYSASNWSHSAAIDGHRASRLHEVFHLQNSADSVVQWAQVKRIWQPICLSLESRKQLLGGSGSVGCAESAKRHIFCQHMSSGPREYLPSQTLSVDVSVDTFADKNRPLVA